MVVAHDTRAPVVLGSTVMYRIQAPDEAPLLAALRAMVGLAPSSKAFPGSNPVSIERVHLPTLYAPENDYYVAEKTDGVRYMLLCTRHGHGPGARKVAALMDRSQRLYLVAGGLPLPAAAFQGSLLDGEVVFNKASGKWNFLVFDAPAVCGVPAAALPFTQRLHYAATCLESGQPAEPTAALQLKMKHFYSVRSAWPEFHDHYTTVVPAVFATDGLIFTPNYAPYVSGRHMTQYKWKPRKDNTVDFAVMAGARKYGILDRGRIVIAAPVFKADMAGLGPPGTIVECEFDLAAEHWRPRGVRADKQAPNDKLTLERTLVNIREDIQYADFTPPS